MNPNQTTVTKPIWAKGLYEYSSIQIVPPNFLTNKVIAWGKENVQAEHLYEVDNPVYGREDEIHVTVLYGIHEQTAEKCLSLLRYYPVFELELGEISLFENPSFDVIKIDIFSPTLLYLNKYLKANIASERMPFSYNPHITVAYIKKYSIMQIEDRGVFKSTKWEVNTLLFSSKQGNRTRIRLCNGANSVKE